MRRVAGGVTVNDTILHIAQEELPFGGVGPSGMGHYHGIEGFRTFSKQKAVFYQSSAQRHVAVQSALRRPVRAP
jgi:coniferyl-aldehyde dehydrogenase